MGYILVPKLELGDRMLEAPASILFHHGVVFRHGRVMAACFRD